MENYKKIDIEFFISKYGIPKKGNPHELWNKIKENKDLLH